MTTATHPQAPGGGPYRTGPPQFTRTTEQEIDGRYRPISTHQIAMAWWLHRSGRITRRQLRIYFAAHEMAEQRRWSSPERQEHARYELSQLRRLVGGRDSATAARDLSADVKQLRELGLVSLSRKAITFATSIEHLRLTGELEDFWTFFGALPHPKRKVPVPRRTLRALAAGFSRGVTAYMLASLIRSVFWHRHPSGGGGEYTTDGRIKGSWVAETFVISRRAVTEARAHLVELGWLEPLEVQQWELNRWGVHDVVNVHWSPANDAKQGKPRSGESATPSPSVSAGSASPCLNRSALPTGDSKTRRLRADAPSPSGVCTSSRRRTRPKRRARPGASSAKPNIRDVRPEDLKDPAALQQLRGQAIGLGLDFAGGAGELDFFALANRALTRGRRPGALFFDLISKHRTAFITIADEDVARGQLRELRDGPTDRDACERRPSMFGHNGGPPLDGGGGECDRREPNYTEDETIVLRCQKAVRHLEPDALFRQARRHLGPDWTLDRWMRAHFSLRQKDAQRWAQPDEEDFSIHALLGPMTRKHA